MKLRALCLLVVLAFVAPALAQLSPGKVITVRTDAELALSCTAGVWAIHATRGEVYSCVGGAFVRMDLPTCNPDPPTGSPTNNPVCLSRANGTLELWGQYGGAWVKVSGASPAGGNGAIQAKSGTGFSDSGLTGVAGALGATGNLTLKPDSDANGAGVLAVDTQGDGTPDVWFVRSSTPCYAGQTLTAIGSGAIACVSAPAPSSVGPRPPGEAAAFVCDPVAQTCDVNPTLDGTPEGRFYADGSYRQLAGTPAGPWWTPRAAPPFACSSAVSGATYFDSDISEPCYCNGSAWTAFDGTGSCS